MVAKDSSLFWPFEGCGLPSGSNHPTPPPCSFTHSGRVAVAELPTFVPTRNVWYPLIEHG